MDVNSEQNEEVDSWSGSEREDEGGRHNEEGSRLSAPGLGSSLSPFSSWWERAILPLPVRWPAPPPESFRWIIGPKDDLLDADVFIDGSLFDGDLPEVAVVGWAFVITRGDDILGLARGVPPEYVRSIPAVEAWGLAMASMLVGTNGRYFTDCKSVKDVARGGRVKATAAGQLHARIWTITFSHTDGDIPEVEWMPSHSARTGVGTLRIGDGSVLTERQWRFNQLVDQHAKEAAAEVRHAPALRHTIKQAQERVATMAQWIARATFAANNGSEPPLRDSEPTAGRRMRQAEAVEGVKRMPRKKEVVQRPMQLGGHQLFQAAGLWKCRCCKKWSRHWTRLAPATCEGAAAAVWAKRARTLGAAGGSDGAGHLRTAIGDLVWCLRCGSYAVSWAVGLAAPCAGAPLNESQKRVRNRLLRGRHPRTNAVLDGRVVMEVPGIIEIGDDELASGGEGTGVGPQPLNRWRHGSRGINVFNKRGVEGVVQARSTAGYLRKPGGARKAFEDSYEGAGEDRVRIGGSIVPHRVNEGTTRGHVSKMIRAIEEGEQEAHRRAQGESLLGKEAAGGNLDGQKELNTRSRKDLLDTLRARASRQGAQRSTMSPITGTAEAIVEEEAANASGTADAARSIDQRVQSDEARRKRRKH